MVANASEVSGVLTASAGFVGLPVGPAEVEPGDIAGGTEISGVSSEPPCHALRVEDCVLNETPVEMNELGAPQGMLLSG